MTIPHQPSALLKPSIDTGLISLIMMATVHQIKVDGQHILHEFGTDKYTSSRLLLAAKSLGMTGKELRQKKERIDKTPFPCLAEDKNGDFFIVIRCLTEPPLDATLSIEKSPFAQQKFLIQKPGKAIEIITLDDFIQQWSGLFLVFKSKASYSGVLAKFDFSWFIPALIKYRHIFIEILLISLFVQIIGLVTPLFFQIVMDKVLVNHAYKTLNVIAVGLVLAIIFEIILTSIRTWVFAHTSSKIDVELGAKLFRHLLNLPIAYFHARRVGDSVARIRELENIRSFLTGNAMTLVIDILFSFIFIAVMASYSLYLTTIVLISIPLYFILSLVFTPIIRRRLDDKFKKTSDNQSFLVESITGIDTIKSMAVEPGWIRKWETQLAAYVTAGLSVTGITTVASNGVALISKLVTAAIMWFGAALVIDNKITIGELIAFNMLSGQVSSPILRLAQMWNDFQQIAISMGRLGDILNAPTEIFEQKTRLPQLEGRIEFDQVSFRYRPDTVDILRDISCSISPGEVIGIVGRSGSGKSTLTRLVQRLYAPRMGRILVDGQDIAIIDTVSLRQQIGVVLQENTLFNRTIRENIAITNIALPIENIIEVARLAGAHEFICELPEGYDTMVGEHGVGLSGGQRQRIAIARALINNPRILIFDEATSALDYESEKIIHDNMKKISQNRTVLIIAHRLTAVREANRILVMDRGQIVERGTHEELLKIQQGIYAHLYQLQSGGEESNASAPRTV
jgi:subfamily B ATP-binding cassette protein HlyB/CyaB